LCPSSLSSYHSSSLFHKPTTIMIIMMLHGMIVISFPFIVNLLGSRIDQT